MDRRSPLGILMTLLIESVSTCVDKWLQTQVHDVHLHVDLPIRTLRKPVMRVRRVWDNGNVSARELGKRTDWMLGVYNLKSISRSLTSS